MKKRFIAVCLCLVLCLSFLSGCRTELNHSQHPEIKEGVLDLRNWDFDQHGIVDLSGPWQFYWKRILSGADLDSLPAPQMTGFYDFPKAWNGLQVKGQPLPGDGYATFTLLVKIQPRDAPLAFKLQDMDTAYNLYIDRLLVFSNGVVGTSRESMVPEFKPGTASFSTSRDQFRIILQVSNFYHRNGGPWSEVQLGSADKIKAAAEDQLLSNGIIIGSILIMGLYHLFMFMLRRKEYSYLYFGILCSLIGLRSLLINERYLHNFFPGLNWEFLQKLEYLSFYLSLPIFLMFIYSVFPNEFKTRILRWIQGISSLFILVVIFSSARVFSSTVNAYQLFTVASGLYVFYVLYKAYRAERAGIMILLGGYLFMFLAAVNEILYVNGLIQTGYSISLGMFVFIFSQAFMLSLRYAIVVDILEDQKIELSNTNISYKDEIVAKQILERNLRKSLQDFQDSRFALIMGLAKLAEYRDEDTGTHLERMREYVKTLAKTLARKEKYRGYITDDYILDIYYSAILHDIGKVGIKDSILLKPDKLSKDEFEIMKTHSGIGGDAIKTVEQKIHMQSFLTLGRQIAYHHHEKWNGTGYPDGLKGEDIPLSARITALADVYDALTSVRPYKNAFSHEKAVKIIVEGSGSHFDPEIVDAFLSQEKMFDKIRDYLRDEPIFPQPKSE